jgi:hypothetical protein
MRYHHGGAPCTWCHFPSALSISRPLKQAMCHTTMQKSVLLLTAALQSLHTSAQKHTTATLLKDWWCKVLQEPHALHSMLLLLVLLAAAAHVLLACRSPAPHGLARTSSELMPCISSRCCCSAGSSWPSAVKLIISCGGPARGMVSEQ